MKYCSKCGNELVDDAVACPHCGCSVENTSEIAERKAEKESKKKSKMITFLILNILSFVIMACSGIFYAYSYMEDYIYEYALSAFFSDPAAHRVFGLFVMVTICLVLSIINMIFYKKTAGKILFWVSVAAVVALVSYYVLYSPTYLLSTLCGVGMLFPVPVILQIIAAIKLIQAKI